MLEKVFGVLCWFWVFLADYGCSQPVFGVLVWFLVFLAGFGCS